MKKYTIYIFIVLAFLSCHDNKQNAKLSEDSTKINPPIVIDSIKLLKADTSMLSTKLSVNMLQTKLRDSVVKSIALQLSLAKKNTDEAQILQEKLAFASKSYKESLKERPMLDSLFNLAMQKLKDYQQRNTDTHIAQ